MIPDRLLQDTNMLKARGFNLSLIERDGKVYVEFKDFPLPEGVYSMDTTNLIIFTSPHYPCASFDMFWTLPELVMKDGPVPKQAEVIETHLGREWRRFSYHPYQNVTWNPSDDNVVKYVGYVQQRLQNGD